MTQTPEPIAVADFDAAGAADAAAELLPCCASRRWISELVAGRPYLSIETMTRACDAALDRLDWAGVLEALAAHPRIGQRATGADREAAWSRQEQAGTAGVPASVREQLHELNIAYQDQFGHVFLICATGLSAEQMLASLRFRLGNDAVTERQTVRTELAKIVRLRLSKLFR